MMRTGPSDDRGALRGRAHFLFDRGNLLFVYQCSQVSEQIGALFVLFVLFCLPLPVADVLLMSLSPGEGNECRLGTTDWLAGWAAGHTGGSGQGKGTDGVCTV